MTRQRERLTRTNAMRLLDQQHVPYIAHRYDPEIKSAQGAAQAMGVMPERVFKTLVLLTDADRALLVMIPGDSEVDLKYFASQIGTRSVRLASHAQAERMTGLLTGGIGALALIDKPFRVYLDERGVGLERILINGGHRGLNLELAPSEVVRLTQASLVRTSL